MRCGLPAVEVAAAGTLAPPDDEADEPQDQEHGCHDPEDVDGESQPEDEQDEQSGEQNDHEQLTSSPVIRPPVGRSCDCSRGHQGTNTLDPRCRRPDRVWAPGEPGARQSTGCPGSRCGAFRLVSTPGCRPVPPTIGSVTMATWSPASTRSAILETIHAAHSSSTGTPDGPGCHEVRANLSVRSPVSSPNSAAVAACSDPSRCRPSRVDRRATSNVRLTLEMQTRKRGGSMLHWVRKPARHPDRSPSGATVVTTASG